MVEPCIRDQLPLEGLDWKAIVPLVGHANACLARYDGMLQTLPNSSILLSPTTANEAVLSSKIEGTQATLDEVLEADAGLVVSEARRGDIEEIMNYRLAVREAEAALEHRPISLSLIKTTHQLLMRGVRGRYKSPGAFRIDQNWIGNPRDTIENARFIPPNPVLMTSGLENWETYINLTTEDPILQTGIAHAQFEILHPFKDGNGRIGRMLIPLILYRRGALSRPMFYMSEYLESNRREYYDRLLNVTEEGDWHGWISFFLNAVVVQAEANLDRVRNIRDLYEEMRRRVVEITHSQFAMGAVDAFFSQPVISASRFAQVAGFSNRVTANNMLRQLEAEGLIVRMREGAGRQPAVYALPALINAAEAKAVFEG